MAKYYEERHSIAAIWCQRFAVFLLPYFLLVILLYRFGKIETVQSWVLIAVGLLKGVFSLIFALSAIAELWSKGYRGGSKVVRGTILTLLVLAPFAYQAFLAVRFPLANDISTDTFSPPEYVNAATFRASKVESGMNPVQEYDDDYSDLVVASYPKLQSRRYPAGPERVLQAVQAIIADNEWPITGTKGLPENRTESEAELDENTTTAGQDEELEDNVAAPDDIFIEILERTLIFGYENDVVIRIISEDQNTLVDVRSSSRWGRHDFGYNARLIESILTQLDTALLGIAGEG